MNLSETPPFRKDFLKAPWPFQQTFQTPLQDLKRFVGTIVSANKSLREGCVIIEQVVFTPRHLNELLAKYSLPHSSGRIWSLTSIGCEETSELLEATFGDWIDFLFVPAPKQFVIYADHDEYATFYANTKSNLNSVTEPLSQQGFKNVANYTRRL